MEVTLYEKEPACGGHTLTDDSAGFPVDVGFQVSAFASLSDHIFQQRCPSPDQLASSS